MINFIINLPRIQKQLIMIISDIFFVGFSLWLAFSLRLGIFFYPNVDQIWLFIVAQFLCPLIFVNFGLYRAIIRFLGSEAIIAIIKGTSILVLAWIFFYYVIDNIFLDFSYIPRTVILIFWLLLILFVGGTRQIARQLLTYKSISIKYDLNVIVYGAGQTGRDILSSLKTLSGIKIIGFVDDNSDLHGSLIANYKVIGDIKKIADLDLNKKNLVVIMAIHSLDETKKKQTINFLLERDISVRVLPSIHEILIGKIPSSNFSSSDFEYLLGREKIDPNIDLLKFSITNKTVLVSGAGGSIGSEICRQAVLIKPKNLIIIDINEYNLYLIEKQLLEIVKENNLGLIITTILSSVKNVVKINQILAEFPVDTIYHAAAYKHVPLMEHNVIECLDNNVIGTLNLADAAIKNNVKNFVLISTDKAVRPTNIMGASKRLSELIVQGINEKNLMLKAKMNIKTNFSIVRFGNVLGSSGSVIPLFKEQIESGGPVTVTHPEVTRYFMTIEEAAQLVIQAGSMQDEAAIYLLDMGKPIKVFDLAKRLILLSGYQIQNSDEKERIQSIKIIYSGLRDGEKLIEELLLKNEYKKTIHPKINVSIEKGYKWNTIEEIVKKVELGIHDQDILKLVDVLQTYVEDYKYIKNKF